MKITKGIFLSDIHMPWNIDLSGVLAYVKDLRPDIVILGGDIIDADGTYGVDSWSAKDVEEKGLPAYKRDVELMKSFLTKINAIAPKAKVVFLEGNHEDRYQRMFRRYPTILEGKFKFQLHAVPETMKARFTWIPYGEYTSIYRVGDMVFKHGDIYPDAHAKKMILSYLPSKVVYGHLHDFQAYTTHNGDPSRPGRYGVTTGCLCGRLPDYKKGQPNRWINGFTDFTCIDGVVTTSSHIIERGRFAVGGRIYGK